MITVTLFASIGMKTVAESFWAGHHDIEMINRNIDTLSNRIKTKNQKISDLNASISTLKSDIASQNSQVSALQQQLIQANIDKQNEINQKINESTLKLQKVIKRLPKNNLKWMPPIKK